MKFSKRTKYMLFGSFIFVAISLRYPFTPHEIGWDSFFIHGLVNSLNHQGHYHSWWVHPLSPFGLTPFSYASAVPVLVSALSQASGLSIETSIWLFGVLVGIFGIFASYLVAKEIFDNDIYIFFVVFGFTTSENFLDFTTWTLTTRGFFIAFLPIFLFFLFRKTKSKKFDKYSILVVISFIYLVAIHHLYTFILFPIIVFTIINSLYPFKNIKKKIILRKIIIIISVIFLISILILIIFDVLTTLPLTGYPGTQFQSKIDWIITSIKIYARQLGVLGLVGIVGFFCLLYKPEKSLNEILLIFFVVVLSPFILISIYMISFVAIFIYLLAGFGLYFIGLYIYKRKYKKITIIIIIIILSISLAFSAFYQVRHPGVEAKTQYQEIYMEEETYDAGLWLKDSINDSAIYPNDITSLIRIAGVMNLKQFPGSAIEQLTNGYLSIDDFEYELRSPFSSKFWSENYYEIKYRESNLNWHGHNLKTHVYESEYSKSIIRGYGIKYVIENNKLLLDEDDENKIFFISLNEKCYNTYSNEKFSIWYID